MTESELYKASSGNDNSGGVNKSSVGRDNVINTNNNGGIDKPSVNKNNINSANVSVDTSSSVSVNKNDNKSNINAKRAKFEEDIKKEPILKTILDMFDGELL